MEKYHVGIIGATGMVGQRFVTLLDKHPWFELTVVAASARSAGKTYREAVGSHWAMTVPIPEKAGDLIVLNAETDLEKIASQVDFVFSAVNMKKEEIRALEEAYARHECPVISNNSAHRWTPDVPMVVPEINPDHIRVIDSQRRRLGTRKGFIAVKSNCSLQSYVPALHPLKDEFGLTKALVCTYQAISGAGKTFETFPEIVDNVIPYIGGEEEKSEKEPLKLWGTVSNGEIVPPSSPRSRPSVCACPAPTATWRRSSCLLSGSPRWNRSATAGTGFPAVPRNWRSLPHRRNSSTISRRMTDPRQNLTETLKTAWLSPSAGCARILSTTTNSSASATTLCAARRAEAYFSQSFCARRATSPNSAPIPERNL